MPVGMLHVFPQRRAASTRRIRRPVFPVFRGFRFIPESRIDGEKRLLAEHLRDSRAPERAQALLVFEADVRKVRDAVFLQMGLDCDPIACSAEIPRLKYDR